MGMMACGWAVSFLQIFKGWEYAPACRIIFFAYAAIGGIKFLLTLGLSGEVEAVKEKDAPLTQQQRQQSAAEATESQPLLADRANGDEGEQETGKPPKKPLFSFIIEKDLVSLLIRLFVLFALDSFASGLASL